MLCITKQIITFSIKKNYNSQKSYFIGDWTVYMWQLHRLPLLAVTGQKPHNKEKAKYPICQDLNGRGTGKRKEKEKREVWLSMIIAAPQLQTSIRLWLFWLPVRYFFIKVTNILTFLPSQDNMPDQWTVLTIQIVMKQLFDFWFNTKSY